VTMRQVDGETWIHWYWRRCNLMLQERREPGGSQQIDLRKWIIRRKLVFFSARGFEKQVMIKKDKFC
jgi:hypothetical protein